MARDKPVRYDAEQLAFLKEEYNKGIAGVKVLSHQSAKRMEARFPNQRSKWLTELQIKSWLSSTARKSKKAHEKAQLKEASATFDEAAEHTGRVMKQAAKRSRIGAESSAESESEPGSVAGDEIDEDRASSDEDSSEEDSSEEDSGNSDDDNDASPKINTLIGSLVKGNHARKQQHAVSGACVCWEGGEEHIRWCCV